MRAHKGKSLFALGVLSLVVTLAAVSGAHAQKGGHKAAPQKPAKSKTVPLENESELTKLRDSYIKATREYKASLEKLLALYKASARKSEERLTQTKKLFADGLVSQHDVEQSEHALADANLKVTEAQTQISGADTQIAQVLIEIEGDKEMAKLGPIPKGGLIKTTSFIRFSGAGSWVLSQSGKIESFFQQTFKRPLPIAVFGQGSIHNQWHLDHRNAMDISLNPDGPEGQALIEFLRRNGIPFSAFRGAIPGVATGPHIHIGMPSHRY